MTQRETSNDTTERRRPPRGARPRPLPILEASAGMVVRRLMVNPADVVFVKGLVDASEGLAAVFAEAGGDIALASPLGREKDLDALLADVAREVEGDRGV